jgi:hypothetical protein
MVGGGKNDTAAVASETVMERHFQAPQSSGRGAVNPMVMAVADQAGGLTFAAEARHLGETGFQQP